MCKRKLLHLIACALLINIALPTFAQYEDLSQKNLDNLEVLTLANGFTIFVKEDFTQGIVHASFVSRGGFSSQNAGNAGFFPLYTSLFLQNAQKKYADFFEQVEVTSQCNSDSSVYTADFARGSFEPFIEAISESAIFPFFTDEEVTKAYTEMKQEVLETQQSVSSFVNSAIDARIFSSSPWKHDTGIYPSLFLSYSIPQVRTELLNISSSYYNPKNCALFISGNITSKEVYDTVKKYFDMWPVHYENVLYQTNDELELPYEFSSKKYVLVDDSFPSEFTQIVVQYTDLSMCQADILNAAFSSANSNFKRTILNEAGLGIMSKDYLNIAATHDSSYNRLILQSLLGEMFFEDNTALSPVAQSEIFLQLTKAASQLTPEDFESAKKEIYSEYAGLSSSSIRSMELLMNFWGIKKDSTETKGFLQSFSELIQNVIDEDLFTFRRSVMSEEPYVFILVSQEKYNQFKYDFKYMNYEVITQENASWYSDELKVNMAFEKQEQEEFLLSNNLEPVSLSPAQIFYNSNASKISSGKLKNNIPYHVFKAPENSNSIISICIDGGEAASPASQKGARTLLINFFAVNIQNEINLLRAQKSIISQCEIRSWTEETVSYITIECSQEDTAQVMEAASRAIIFEEMQPLTADRLVYEQRTNYLTERTSLIYQMKNLSLAHFFAGTLIEKCFKMPEQLLSGTSYYSINEDYMSLLNASLYSIFLYGNFTTEETEGMLKNTFGVLMEQTERKPSAAPKINMRPKTYKEQITHYFSTDRPASEASPESPILIPTKEFTDPVIFYSQSPETSFEREIYNALLEEICWRMQKELKDNCTVEVFEATNIINAGAVYTEGILHTAVFERAYKNAVAALEKELTQIVKERNETIAQQTRELEEERKRLVEEAKAKLLEEKLNLLKEKLAEELEDENLETPELPATIEISDDEITIEMREMERIPDETLICNIKNRWTVLKFTQTQTAYGNASLIQQGIMEGNPLLYLENFLKMEDADAQIFLTVLKTCIPQDAKVKVYSSDSMR